MIKNHCCIYLFSKLYFKFSFIVFYMLQKYFILCWPRIGQMASLTLETFTAIVKIARLYVLNSIYGKELDKPELVHLTLTMQKA